MFAGCSDQGPAHSHYHNCFLQLFNQLDLVDIVLVFCFHLLLRSSVRSPCAGSDPSKAVAPLQRGPGDPHPVSPFYFFFLFKCFCDNQKQTFVPLQARRWPPFQGEPGHTWGHLAESTPAPPPTLTVVTCTPAGRCYLKIKRPLSRTRHVNISLSISLKQLLICF